MSTLACCGPFGALVDEAGIRGLSIVASRVGQARGFRLQTRAFDAATEASEIARRRSLPVEYRGNAKIALHAQIGMRFCPFCGTDLQELIRANEPAFDELSARHAGLLLP